MDLADATLKVTSQNGNVGVNSAKKGQVRFNQKRGAEAQEGVSDAPRHSILVELKDVKVAPLQNKSGYPDAFPREGSKKVFDNPRVVVWDFSWTPGKATAMQSQGSHSQRAAVEGFPARYRH